MPAIEVEDLHIHFGALRAVDGVSFTSDSGEVLALLGPNGAGKTTTVEALVGYRRPDAGQVRVLGCHPVEDRDRLNRLIGIMPQEAGVYPGVRPLEILRLYAAFHERSLAPEVVLDRVGLGHRRDATWRQLSGGEQQRLSLAMALIGRPTVVFLDEPAAGMDVSGRQLVRRIVRELTAEGVAVLVTTHDLDEAEKIADRVVIIDRGRLAAVGTPSELMASTSVDEIRFGAPVGLDTAALGKSMMAAVREIRPGEYLVQAPPTPANVAMLTTWLAERDLPLADLRAGRQRLEDVFLRLTSITGEMPAIAPPEHRRAVSMSAVLAQTRLELVLTLRRGESVLLTFAIPVLLLGFFSTVDVLPTDTDDPVSFLFPGVLALAVMSTSMVSLAIATGFERQAGVLKRLGATPLTRRQLIAAKTLTVLAVEALQIAILFAEGLLLGWDFQEASVGLALLSMALATVAFAGVGMLMAGSLPALTTLAAANGLYLLLLLVGGMVVPLSELPEGVQAVARILPSGALSDATHGALGPGQIPVRAWLVLAAWALVAPAVAAWRFRWE